LSAAVEIIQNHLTFSRLQSLDVLRELSVDVYQSPFGEVKVVLNRFMVNTDHLVFNPSDWKLAVLRAWERVPLAKIGDSERHMIVGEYSLKHANYKASAVVRKST
jgi:hypothetical protein